MKKKKNFLVLLFVLIILILIWKFDVFSIEKINVNSFAECLTNQDLIKEINEIDKNWLDLKSDKIQNILKSKYLCIKDVNLSYQFPKTMKVTVTGRKFLTKVFFLNQTLNFPELESSASSEAALLDWTFPTESSIDALIADNTGFIFSKKPPDFPLPVLYLSENLTIGKQLDIKKFNVLEQIFEKYPQLKNISSQSAFSAKISGNTLLINNSPKIVFSLERDVLRQLASLQLILQKAKIDQRAVEIIDLRFDKPVVEYQPKLSK